MFRQGGSVVALLLVFPLLRTWFLLVVGGYASALTSLRFSDSGIACSASVVLMVAQTLDSMAVTFLHLAIAAPACT